MNSRLLIAIACLGLGFAAGQFGPRLLGAAGPLEGSTGSAVARPAPESSRAAAAPVQRAAVPSNSVVPSKLAVPAKTATGDVPAVRTLAETADISSEFLQSAALYQLAAPMGAEGIRRLLDEAEQALSGGDYQGGTSLLIGRYAELDFAAALDYALANGGRLKANWLQSIFHSRARIDVDDALAQAQQLSKSQQQIAGIAMLRSSEYLSKNQRRSIIDTLNLPDQIVATAQFPTADAWANVQNIADPMQRIQAQSRVLMNWARSDPWAAFEASREIENAQMRSGIQSQLLGMAAADDPQRALDWLNSQPEGQLRDQMTAAVVARIGASDPDQAEALIAALPEDKRVQAEMGLWMQRAASDPEGAARWVASLEIDEDRQSMRIERMVPMQMLSVMTMTSPEAAERFINALPADRRSEMEPTYVQILAQRDPVAAADRLERITDDQQRASASQSLVSSWAQQDPVEASRWIERQPNDASPALFRSLGASWSHQNLTSARDYAEGMRAGVDRDHMYTGILTSGRVKPDEASGMLDQIEDAALRAEAEQMQEMMRKAMLDASFTAY